MYTYRNFKIDIMFKIMLLIVVIGTFMFHGIFIKDTVYLKTYA